MSPTPRHAPTPTVGPSAAHPAAGSAGLSPDIPRDRRVPLDLAIFTYPLDEPETAAQVAASRNVSRAGMFVATGRPHAPGQMLFLEAFPPGVDDRPVRCRAVVRWRRRWFEPRGMGVELLDLEEADQRRLLHWMGGTSGGGETPAGGAS